MVPSRSFAGLPLDLVVFVLREPSAFALLKHTGFEDLLLKGVDDSVLRLVLAHHDLHIEVKNVGKGECSV